MNWAQDVQRTFITPRNHRHVNRPAAGEYYTSLLCPILNKLLDTMDLTLERRNILTQRGKIYKPQEKIDYCDRQKHFFSCDNIGKWASFHKVFGFCSIAVLYELCKYDLRSKCIECTMQKNDNNTQGLWPLPGQFCSKKTRMDSLTKTWIETPNQQNRELSRFCGWAHSNVSPILMIFEAFEI